MRASTPLAGVCLLAAACVVLAAPPARQDTAELARAGADWLRTQVIARHPGLDARVEVTPLDTRLRLAACAAPRYGLPARSLLWGAGNLHMACESPAWSLYTPYRVSLRGPALVSRQAVRARQGLGPDSVSLVTITYLGDPDSYLQDPAQLTGKELAIPLDAGTPLRRDMLRRAMLVKPGQRVHVVVSGAGFEIGQEAVAQQAGAAGESIRLKTAGGRLLQGRVEADGTVSILP